MPSEFCRQLFYEEVCIVSGEVVEYNRYMMSILIFQIASVVSCSAVSVMRKKTLVEKTKYLKQKNEILKDVTLSTYFPLI